ncbi:MAG: tryptophan synthase subunit alpha [Lachnospiraceae bacterium]|nr:tryptophan synthase subunit alpha [Lachnospiraceae bacterium]
MNRIEKRMNELKLNNEKAFITYITAGLPDMDKTKDIIKAQEGITDVIELGIPFSDPTADGPVIQQASYEAIQGGATLKKAFKLMEDLREGGSEQPIVFMMYYNTIVNYGIDDFVKKCSETGVDGLIVPDLPMEEQEALKKALGGSDDTILIELVSPISDKRIPEILKGARGFVYCVSSMGVTGQAADFHKEVISYLSRVKEVSDIPVMMGFGIREAGDVTPMKDIIDGCIVGSYFINLMRENDFKPEAAREYAQRFKKELNSK